MFSNGSEYSFYITSFLDVCKKSQKQPHFICNLNNLQLKSAGSTSKIFQVCRIDPAYPGHGTPHPSLLRWIKGPASTCFYGASDTELFYANLSEYRVLKSRPYWRCRMPPVSLPLPFLTGQTNRLLPFLANQVSLFLICFLRENTFESRPWSHTRQSVWLSLMTSQTLCCSASETQNLFFCLRNGSNSQILQVRSRNIVFNIISGQIIVNVWINLGWDRLFHLIRLWS